ncbi:MAG: L-threonylcarbamoyladenylate synthase [Clostridia bacterium]|nr:L-threonylcarbamoyladenylate synthase [Clostridia bacterium]
METKILKTDDNSIAEAGEILKCGGLAAFPTETVYGLGANAFLTESVKKIYEAKGRPSDNPLIVHIADIDELYPLVSEINDNAKALIHAFMPGAFTVILKKSRLVPDAVTAGMDTVAIRFPSNETAQRLIKAAGVPIAAPSANISGKPSPTKAKYVISDMLGRIDAIIDGEDCEVGVESTIVDASGEIPVLLRPGGITLEDLREVVPETKVDEHILTSVKQGEQPLCPGMKYKHYAPDAEVTVVEGDMKSVKAKIDELLKANHDKVCGVLTMSENAYDSAIILSGGITNKEYARNLFSNLREFDNLGVDIVFAEFESRDGYGLAIKNRLYKSASQRVIYV